MKRIILAAALAVAVYAYALPGDLLVVSKKEVKADAAAGLSYLGSCASGYLYAGSAAALGRAAPYRVLDDRATGKHYFLISLPKRSALTAADLALSGKVTPVGKEFLLGVGSPGEMGVLLAREPRLRIRELAPTTRVEWKAAAETPPTIKNAAIDAAIKTVTADEYAGYISKLQSYGTRYSFTSGCEAARNWLRNWFAGQNLSATWDPFACGRYEDCHYPEAGGSIYLDDYHCMVRRSRDRGASWETMRPARGTAGSYYNPPACCWLDADTGFIAGIDGYLATTSDGGERWRYFRYAPPVSEEVYREVYNVTFTDAEIGWVGYADWANTKLNSYLLKTEDGGRTWREQTMPAERTRAVSAAFFDARHGWIANGSTNIKPYFSYTGDGGATWQPCTDPLSDFIYRFDLAAVGSSSAWAAHSDGGGGWLYRTTDGVTWAAFHPGVSGFYRQIEFPDPLHGFAAGSNLIMTTDGGATWHEVTTAPDMEINTMAFADANHGVIVDSYGEDCYRTDDGGRTWVDIGDGLNAPEYNVVAERVGTEKPDEIVIVGGHYDSISTERPWVCPGAEDDASGTAVAMCAARAFRNTAFKRTVRFMGFGDEEAYLLGSAAYAEECAARGEKIVAVLNADMVSYDEENGGRDDLMVGAADEYEWLVNYLKAVGALYGQNLIYDWDDSWVSDDAPFADAGYAALGVIEGEVGVGGDLEYPWYHTPGDTLDKIQPAFGARFTRDFAATLAHLAGVAGTFPDPPEPGSAAKPTPRAFAVYPNPYRVTSFAAGFHFVGLATPATVKVYDLAGRRVASWAVGAGDECTWRPAAAAGGGSLAAGIYLYVVEGDNQREVGKLALVK